MIGKVELYNGLYYLQEKKHISLINTFNYEENVSHSLDSLGHPLDKVLDHIRKMFSNIHFNKNILCEPCHLAKQRKLTFAQSRNVSTHFFYLIHVDIWDPIGISSIQGYKYFLTIVDDFSR